MDTESVHRKTCAYRFGFVLTTAAGNLTRYLNLRKYAERDLEVECVWAPISHYLEPDPFRRLPDVLRTRLIVERQCRPVMRRLHEMDAVMFHAFEPYLFAAWRSQFRRRPLICWSQDNPPLSPAHRKLADYGGTKTRPGWRRRWRFWLDTWCVRHTALFFPFSHWAGRVLVEDCGVPAEKVHPINVGLDLELWPYVPEEPVEGRPKILFVGGDFQRKGGDLLLEVYCCELSAIADLVLVTRHPPKDLPPGVSVFTDLTANDPRLRQLYADCAVYVLPTRADMSPWVVLEAMATGRPVIATSVGGIPDMVADGKTGFLITPGDGVALAHSLRRLLQDVTLRRCFGVAGREKVEREFNAEVCVPRILGVMKQAVDGTACQHGIG
ncbi:MAG: glycosyltransferase family 4 protein [Chloroherpetonaceae bacterium]|nr:glycosyltransferase family 4 protein [Chthonomonadaceae bacterium]MDW8209037.1 glycosyltransferase family 4 protein [Chloroherpetonaceae bacterium]